MTRIKRGYKARRRRKKICSFTSTFIGAHSRLTRTTTQQRIRALVSSHRDRNRKKRDFRRLWITRINSITRKARKNRLFYSYSLFIKNMYKSQLLLNHKILFQITLSNKNYFDIISNKILIYSII
uniref:ribosomal protein L20 n=1 Tax=Yoania japonica TaxID=1325471 RepID=UPI00226D2F97|nr:ribosomal protein L20 [Yoania japonica]UZA66599.1 ribosomal protein L20 [Yoania japonica]UZA66624.1 ribosomal protein L20 [Yoania japonica]